MKEYAVDYARDKPEIEEFFVNRLWRTIGRPMGDVDAGRAGETLLITATKNGDLGTVGPYLLSMLTHLWKLMIKRLHLTMLVVILKWSRLLQINWV